MTTRHQYVSYVHEYIYVYFVLSILLVVFEFSVVTILKVSVQTNFIFMLRRKRDYCMY